MNMKLFLIVSSEGFPVNRMQVKVAGSLNAFMDKDTFFERYKSLRAAIPALAAALQSEELIVLAAEPKLFDRTKKNLTAALSLPCEENPEILKRLRAELSEEERRLNALLPVGSTVFPTRDGIGSGFAVRKGGQEIMLLSLDEERLDTVLRSGVIPYLTSGETMEPPESGAASASQEEAADGGKKRRRVSEVLLHTANLLREQNCRVAVCGNANSACLKAFGKNLPSFDELFTFTPFVADKGDYNMTDYTAQTARAARELASADYGACISDVCDRGECAFICVAVAGESSAIVRKLYRESGETDESFAHDAAEDLLELIGERVSGTGSVGIEISQGGSEPAEGRSSRSKSSHRVLLAVLLLLLAAALTVGGYFLAVRQKAKKARPPEPPIRHSDVTPEAKPEPVKLPDGTIFLSHLMFREALGGVSPRDLAQADGAAAEDRLPETITVNGVALPAKEAVASLMAAEVSGDTNAEALKAQAVAVYTYLKYRNTNFVISDVTLADTYSDNIYHAVEAVFGEWVSYEDKPAFTPYFRLSAGRTASAENVYGKAFPYLQAVTSPEDRSQDGYKTEKSCSSQELKARILAYDGSVVLPEKPSDWIEIVRHDGAINTGVGYNETVRVGDREISGLDFKEKVLNGEISSHCFAFRYVEPEDSFKFTAYGNGLGVGLSLLGANRMAGNGAGYARILAKYYPGTKLS